MEAPALPPSPPSDDVPPPRWLPLRPRTRIHWWERLWILVGVGFVLLFFALLFLGELSGDGPTVGFGIALAMLFLPAFVFKWVRQRHDRRIEDDLRARNFLVCPECLYDLQSIPSPGRCPECGTPFDAAQLPTAWRRIEQRWFDRTKAFGD